MSCETSVVRDQRTDVVVDHRTDSVVLVDLSESTVVQPEPEASVVVQREDSDVLVAPTESTVVVVAPGTQGIPGPPGIPGPAGGQVLQRKAGMETSALLVVYEDLFGSVWPADSDVESDVLALLGVTVSAAEGGQPINVQRMGHIDDDAWQLQPGKRVFLGKQGRLTQEPPQGGYDVLIGMAITSTRLLLNIQDPIELE